MAGLVLGNGYKVRLLTAKIPLLNKLTISLFNNMPIIDGTSQVSDFSEPRYLGLLRFTPLKWGFARLTPNFYGLMPAQAVSWDRASFIDEAFINGYFMIDENGFFAFGAYFPRAEIVGPQEKGLLTFQPRMYENTMTPPFTPG